MDHAAGNKHLDVMQYLHSRNESCSALAYPLTAREGRLQELIWLTCNFPGLYHNATFTDAAARGHLRIVTWLHGNSEQHLGYRVKTTTAAMDWAAAGGHLEIVTWLHENRSEGCGSDALDMAAANGYLYVVQWLHENRVEGCTVPAIDDAATNRHLDVVRWLHNNRQEGATTDAMDGAAAGGHREVVFWLRNKRNEGYTSAAVDGAIAIGDMELLRWFYANHIGCTAIGFDRAIEARNIEMIPFLSRTGTEGCTVNGYVSAVRNGHLHIARWILVRQPHWYDEKDFDRVKLKYGWTSVIILAAIPWYSLVDES
ncbi:hypothetical protein PHMEG_00016555 [Phytophthora megakarya]|uniref:Uncharacterized protein n=1 Tax=Phytophthora megakarya TaxID=4795 RepID=A0A225VYQ7_9STRA|nr:hypothetical protein PHMEG_00016555 [Phytophthora megakarya]